MEEEKIRELLANDHFAVTSGILLNEVNPGYAVASLKAEQRHINGGGVVQGGALFTLADFAMAAAANAHGRLALSLQSDIRFLTSVREGETIRATAQELKLGNTICTYEVKVTNERNELIAQFTGSCFRFTNR